jgi:hypothetical protein
MMGWDGLWLQHALMHADSENHPESDAHTLHSDGDETTNLSATPAIPHPRRHSASMDNNCFHIFSSIHGVPTITILA